MLSESQLRQLAAAIHENLFQAHRGAVPVPAWGTVLAFGYEGYAGSEKARDSAAKARAALAADGWTLGPVVTCGQGYTWVFEADHEDTAGIDDMVAIVEEAVWEGWAATRSVDPTGPVTETTDFASYQRGIARRACASFDADAVLVG